MRENISRPPRTIMEVYKMLPEGTLAELIEGTIYMTPPPNMAHQETVTTLVSRIFSWLEQHQLGKVFVAPFGVYLDDDNAVEPDIVFISNARKGIIRDDGVHGTPDLLIEILSPGNKNNDKIQKKNLYERFGVTEYWIIDPSTKEAIGYLLENGKYVEFFRGNELIRSNVLNAKFSF